MAPSIPRYNNLWEELFPSPDMSRNPDVRSGKRKKMVGPLHVNRWGPNKEAWGKIGRFILGLPSQEEIEKYAKIRNNRVNNTQQPVELPPAAQNSLYDSQGRNVFDGTTLKGENERKAELISNANKTSLASKVNSEETPNSSDPQTAGSTVFTKDKEGKALGVMTRNQRKNWEAENANWQSWQPEGKGYTMSSVLKNDGSLDTNKAINKSIAQIPEGSTRNFWNKEIPLIDTKGMKGTPTFGIPKGIDLDKGSARMADMLNPANMDKMPSFKDSMTMNKGGGISGAATLKIASMILDAMKPKQKPSTAGMEGKGGNIDQVAVAAGIDPEQFYSMV